jgi:hypothetical protein
LATAYTPAATSALEDAAVDLVRERDDPLDFTTEGYNVLRWDALYGAVPMLNEILGLIAGRVSSMAYGQTFACLAGLNVGDPVRISADNTVVLALATNAGNAKVFAFCRYKPTAITCYVDHYRYISGLAGGTAGNPVYLTDVGGYGAIAGSVTKIVGTWISTTEALVKADPLTAQ